MEEQKSLFLKAYNEHANALFRFCYFKLSDREAAKEAVQEVFMKVWNYITTGKKIDHFKSFLYVTASNHVKDQWKKKSAIPISVLDTEEELFDVADPNIHKDIEKTSELNIALRYMQKLAESDREILTLRFIEGLPPSEIAPMLGVRENVVSVRINRAMTRLKNLYGHTKYE